MRVGCLKVVSFRFTRHDILSLASVSMNTLPIEKLVARSLIINWGRNVLQLWKFEYCTSCCWFMVFPRFWNPKRFDTFLSNKFKPSAKIIISEYMLYTESQWSAFYRGSLAYSVESLFWGCFVQSVNYEPGSAFISLVVYTSKKKSTFVGGKCSLLKNCTKSW